MNEKEKNKIPSKPDKSDCASKLQGGLIEGVGRGCWLRVLVEGVGRGCWSRVLVEGVEK